ncbi:MAG: tRNA (adenosine(37)-N6)-dimethylallyltransferase MiaA [Micropepsaceae bacterium]
MGVKTECVLIAGPTASGKSAVAMALARATGGVIVNADSMQIYDQLRILSARPSAAEEAEIPHRLFGIADVRQPFSVARWLDAVRPVLAELKAEGRLAIVTGGTGLYFKALEQGLSAAPSSTEEGRAAARRQRELLGAEAFHAELVRLDPASVALKPGDTQRTLRAWEVVVRSGRGLSAWQEGATVPAIDLASTARFVIDMERPQLNARIDARFDQMMADGALEEARAFWALNPDPMLPAAKTLGLPQFRRALANEIGLADAIADAKLQTRRFAKRQSTWFRNQTASWAKLTASDTDAMIANICQVVG